MPTREPTNLMRKFAAALFPDDPSEQEHFLEALLVPTDRGSAVVRTTPEVDHGLKIIDRVSLPDWIPDSIDHLSPGEKPGACPAYEQGGIYPLDFSSVLTGSAMLEAGRHLDTSPTILDLCAAPGGKSILASTWLKPTRLIANEVEGKRLGVLRHNLSRCHVESCFTQRLRAEEWGTSAPGAFDLCLVDAPCSGQSLLAKKIENAGCFHPSTIKGNARRQIGILSAVAPAVRKGGFLFYSTCTFARRENEGAIEKWLSREADFVPVEVPHLAEFRSDQSEFPSYRVYPHKSDGAGGFVCLLRREGNEETAPIPEDLLGYPVG